MPERLAILLVTGVAYAIALLLLAVAMLAAPARAAPPPDADPRLHSWFDRQHSVKGAWCCDVADGHVLDDEDVRTSGDHYEIRLAGDGWVVVPNDAMRDPKGGVNPTGHAIAWYTHGAGGLFIWCFAPGTGL